MCVCVCVSVGVFPHPCFLHPAGCKDQLMFRGYGLFFFFRCCLYFVCFLAVEEVDFPPLFYFSLYSMSSCLSALASIYRTYIHVNVNKMNNKMNKERKMITAEHL